MSLFAKENGRMYHAVASSGARRNAATGPRIALPSPHRRERSRPGPNWERITLVAASTLVSLGLILSAVAALATLR
ncbi:hypothetical protein [Alsobacter sp. R-9]